MVQKNVYFDVILEFVQDIWQRMDETGSTKSDRFGEEGVRRGQRIARRLKDVMNGEGKEWSSCVHDRQPLAWTNGWLADIRTIHGRINPLWRIDENGYKWSFT